jgi:hypothetical protein
LHLLFFDKKSIFMKNLRPLQITKTIFLRQKSSHSKILRHLQLALVVF